LREEKLFRSNTVFHKSLDPLPFSKEIDGMFSIPQTWVKPWFSWSAWIPPKGPVHGFCGIWGVLAAAFFDWGKAGHVLWIDTWKKPAGSTRSP